MLIAAEKGARLIVSVGAQYNLVEFLDRNRQGMSSTFLTRLRIGEILVDAKGVSRLYQPRPGLTVRHASWKLTARAFPTAGAGQPVKLIFGDQWFDFGDFPNLVPQRFWVASDQGFATTAAALGLDRHDRQTLFGCNQGPLVLGMARLSALLLAALLLLRPRLGMWMFGARRKRRIAGCLLQLQRRDLGFQRGDSPILLGDPRQQKADDRLRFRRLPGDHVFRDQQILRHANDVADFAVCAKANLAAPATPGCERLLGQVQ